MGITTASIGRRKYETNIQARNKSIVADEPASEGGGDKGFTPHELLAASLSSCICITLRMYADRKQWDVDDVIANVSITRDNRHTILNIHVEMELKGELSDDQKKRLMEIADHCPIHKALINATQITTSIK